MDVILLERIAKLGQMGDVVRVRPGFARNYLLPQGKALRANKANMARFEKERAQLEARNLERKTEAEQVAEKLSGQSFVIIRAAGDGGQLYGSVSTRDIADILTENGFSLGRNQVNLNNPIKAIGMHTVEIGLHPEVEVSITVNVARSPDEAERQARGEDVTVRGEEADEKEDISAAVAEVFEDEDLAKEAEAEFEEATLEGEDAAGETADATGEAAARDEGKSEDEGEEDK